MRNIARITLFAGGAIFAAVLTTGAAHADIAPAVAPAVVPAVAPAVAPDVHPAVDVRPGVAPAVMPNLDLG